MEKNLIELGRDELRDQLVALLHEKKFGSLRAILDILNPADIALIFAEVEETDLPLLFRLLPKEAAAEVFVEMDNDQQEFLISAFSDTELKEVLDELYVDDAVDLIEEMPASVVKRILRYTDPETRKSINQLLQYPKDSAGSIMTIEYVDLKKHMTVAQSFDRIRKTGVDKETIYTCYVTDQNRKLIGLVSVKDLLLAESDQVIDDIMETNIIYVRTLDDQEDVARMFDKYGFLAIPVVDREERLVGIVTVDDAIDVLQKENTEDISKMGAVIPSEETYLKTPVWRHAKNRIFWLLFLMLSATLTGSIIQHYEEAFVTIPILVAFVPMLMDTGGNCGSQSSTMIIRGLALDEIRFKDFFRVLFKEFRVAILVGIVLAVVNGLRVFLMYQGNQEVLSHMTLMQLATVSGLSLIGTVVLAKCLGCILPMAAKKCKMDPALMASPLLTTILDTCSVFLFFNIAMALLHL
ncbi:magnesium transporter [Ructibacterium gallinarum]|uniref:Magnesium transporter MgtE n=1 Tax=Ructibacterium gallinarum TaxID=2779355 RepID=A0A9D5R7T7_9FIRM|nr:magnesium transporter [Ructibacterium gallinarum]MBE5039190.1 magnesium transporter [Ructibacterium gallinarum]